MYAIRSYYVWLKITEFPYLNDVNLEDYEIVFQENLLNTLLQIGKEKAAKTITDFKKAIVITSYSIHYTKLYDSGWDAARRLRPWPRW